MPELILISGPPGVGKSTIAQALGERRERCAVLERDSFYGFYSTGLIPPWSSEATAQNDASLRACARAAGAYLDYCDVVLAGVIDNSSLRIVLAELGESSIPIHFIRMVAERQVAIARALKRSRNVRLAISEERYGVMFDQYMAQATCLGAELDSTALTPDDVTASIEQLVESRSALVGNLDLGRV